MVINMNKSIGNYLVWFIFLFIGTIFLIISFFLYKRVFNYQNVTTTKGVITDIVYKNDNNLVYVNYFVNGIEHESKLNGYSSSFKVGKEIDIYYNNDNPDKIGVKSLDYVFLLFPFFGLLFTIISAVGIAINLKKKDLQEWLINNGDIIYADYISTDINKSYTINGKHPYNILCRWIDPIDNKEYVFKSNNIWENVDNIIKYKKIKQFKVYIDSNNKKKYYVDLEEIS